MRRPLYLVLPLLLSSACGYTDAGGGSKTLEVRAELRFHANDNQTRAEVMVRKSGAAVEGAMVVITDGDTDDTFTLPQRNNGNDTDYQLDIPGYHRKVALKVESGSDDLNGKLEGPGSFVIAKPNNGEILDRSELGDRLEVQWVTKDGVAAEEVTVRFHDEASTVTVTRDRGSEDLQTAYLQPQEDEVRVARRNRVTLDGGVLSSVLEMSYEVANDVIVQE